MSETKEKRSVLLKTDKDWHNPTAIRLHIASVFESWFEQQFSLTEDRWFSWSGSEHPESSTQEVRQTQYMLVLL
jgi:hypothetical protein